MSGKKLRWKPVNQLRGSAMIDQNRAWALDWMCSLETQCKELGLPSFQSRLWDEIHRNHEETTDGVVDATKVSLHRCLCVMAHIGLNVISEDQFRRLGTDPSTWTIVVNAEKAGKQ